jgi:hypothetical protein
MRSCGFAYHGHPCRPSGSEHRKLRRRPFVFRMVNPAASR